MVRRSSWGCFDQKWHLQGPHTGHISSLRVGSNSDSWYQVPSGQSTIVAYGTGGRRMGQYRSLLQVLWLRQKPAWGRARCRRSSTPCTTSNRHIHGVDLVYSPGDCGISARGLHPGVSAPRGVLPCEVCVPHGPLRRANKGPTARSY